MSKNVVVSATMNYTPGPYSVVARQDKTFYIVADSPRGQIELATVHREAEYQAVLPANENAALFAAAPDMLEALKLSAEVFRAKGWDKGLDAVGMTIIEAAIAKAEGR